jgi:competence protein ComEA
MNMLRKWVRDVFGFSGREVNGFLILLPLMVLIIFSEPVYRLWLSSRTIDYSKEERSLDSLAQLWKEEVPPTDTIKFAVFNFDPNKISMEDLEHLGFSKSLSTRIASYRSKGGTFRIKSDLLKIYGIDTTLYARLYDHILLPVKFEKKGFEKQNFEQREKTTVKSQKNHFTQFDLNQADSTQLKSVYGIGSKLALRILRFREALGGFVHTQQLKEVYGLDTTVVNTLTKRSFIDADFTPQKVNMNTATEEEFAAHPYLKKNIAKALVAYRFQHGKFTDVQDIRKLSGIKPEQIDKIIPYLTIAE